MNVSNESADLGKKGRDGLRRKGEELKDEGRERAAEPSSWNSPLFYGRALALHTHGFLDSTFVTHPRRTSWTTSDSDGYSGFVPVATVVALETIAFRANIEY
jgi:hypothetical protein